jgi:hypothetical protein
MTEIKKCVIEGLPILLSLRSLKTAESILVPKTDARPLPSGRNRYTLLLHRHYLRLTHSIKVIVSGL